MQNEGLGFYLIYLLSIPIGIYFIYLIILHFGFGLLMPILGASLTLGSLVIHKYFPWRDYHIESPLAIASAAVWLFEFVGSYLSPDFNPIFLLLFFVSLLVFWYVRSD